jgi:hypothetical protein
MQSHLIPQKEALDFILAGRATFTFKSTKTGKWYTYKAEYDKLFGVEMIKVKLLTGSDNINSFTYMCRILKNNCSPDLEYTKNSRISKTSPAFIGFSYVFYNLLVGREMPSLEIWHEGKCCRCGRKLTVPESISSGIGPECATKTNMFIF